MSFDSSDSDKPRKCTRKNELEELRKENALLRSQFDEAVSISSQMEKLHEHNTALIAQLRDLKAERDDLEHRLDISMQSNRELTDKLAEEKKASSSQRGVDITTMEKELTKLKKASKTQLDSVCDRLEEAQQNLEQEKVDKKMIISKVDRLMQAAERCFHCKFETLDSLMAVLETPETIKKEPKPAQPAKPQLEKTVPAKKAKKMKAMLKREVAMREQAEGDVKKVKQQCHEAQITNKQQVAALERQISQMNDEREMSEVQHKFTVSKLETKVDGLQAELGRAQAKLKQTKAKLLEQVIASQTPAPEPPVQEPVVVVKKDKKCKAMKKKIVNLQEQLSRAEARNDGIGDRLKDTELLVGELELAIEKQKTEYNALRLVHEETLAEVETLRASLHAKDEVNKKAVAEAAKLRKPNPKIVKLERCIDEQKQKIYALEIANSKQQTVIEDKNQKLREAEAANADLHATIRKNLEELRCARQKAEAVPKPTAEELVPPEAFYVADVDPKLSSKLLEIAQNDLLQPVTKVQSAIKAAVKHYNNIIAARDAALDEAYTENQRLGEAFTQFLVDVSIVLTDKPTTLQEFFTKGAGNALVSQIARLRAQYNDARHQCECHANAVKKFHELFGDIVEKGDAPIKQITDVKQRLDAQAKTCASRGKKIRTLKTTLNQVRSNAKEQEENFVHQIESLRTDVRQLTEERDDLAGSLSQAKLRCQSLTEELESANEARAELETTMVAEHEHEISKLTEEFAERERQLQGQLGDVSKNYEALANEYKECQEQITGLKKTIHGLKAANKQLETEFDDFMKECAQREVLAEERLELEKKNITETYENAIAELHNQCEAHRSDVEKLSAALTAAENSGAASKIEIAKLRKENRKLTCEVESLRDELERQKKLMESSLRAAKISAESHYTMKLEEQKAKSEADIRALCAYGADTFREFFDAHEQINERTFKIVLERVHGELARLSKSDAAIRRMVRAIERQTTQDAVAQAVMKL